MLTFATQYNPNGIPTNAASATIVVTDNTTQTVVYSGAMANPATGVYQYQYSSEVAGHTYLGVMTLTATNGSQIVSQQVFYVQPQTTVPQTTDDGSSSYISKVWAEQRGLWTSIKYSALSAVATALALGEGPSYSISGRLGSESLSLNEFLANMRETAKVACEMEIELTNQIQLANPFEIRQCLGVRSRWQG